ncbi:benzoate 4-monooxygenase [Fusarium sp. NRRL 52700]|nr:benzoate 4-monooxygenase [Fusarium sp. NRRL 52700]
MCRETITIAQCAPVVAPVLAFYCAKLHLVAKDRVVCDAAKGKCICFFGSCGAIDREIPTKGINLNELVKARCAECTPREHRVGNGIPAQQILESVLLRSADAQNGWEERSKLVSELWLNKPACPYHADSTTESTTPIAEAINITQHVRFDDDAGQSGAGVAAERAGLTDPTHEHATELSSKSAELEPTVEKDDGGFSDPGNSAMKDVSSSPIGPIFTDSLVAEPASSPAEEWPVNSGVAANAATADEWSANTAPAGEQGYNTKDHGSDSEVKNILDPEEVGIATSRWAPGNSPINSTKPNKPAVEVNVDESGEGQERAQTPVVDVSRRAVNFSYDPNNAEKLLETAEMFAQVKAFLMAKA